jgi:hypothetical protein
VASDFHPKRGSLAALPPHRTSLKNGVGKKIKDVAREFNEDPVGP